MVNMEDYVCVKSSHSDGGDDQQCVVIGRHKADPAAPSLIIDSKNGAFLTFEPDHVTRFIADVKAGKYH